MKRVLLIVALFTAAFAISVPVNHTLLPPPAIELTAQPAVIMETLDPSLIQYEDAWRDEIARRFPRAVGLLVHGGDFVAGQWIVGAGYQNWKHVTPTAEVVRHYQTLYPDRTIVLLACNPGHLKLGIPGVYYASSSVWCIPDRSLKPSMFLSSEARATTKGFEFFLPDTRTRWEIAPDVVGNIFEFVRE